MPERFIGLISGTSMDGIDAVLASFGEASVELHARLAFPYPAELASDLRDVVAHPSACSADRFGDLDRRVGKSFRDAALAVLADARIGATEVSAIGSHGQTIRHRPDATLPFSVQIGDPATIAIGTGIVTVADFRRADIAAGGQGAPLVPPFHSWLFGSGDTHRVVLNVGGIANVTILGAGNSPVTGFDTGPGNTLLDAWTRRHRDEAFDRGGAWARRGRVIEALLDQMLAFEYFDRRPPKSTGLETFNLSWLDAFDVDRFEPIDVQATLCELTARSIARDVGEHAPAATEIWVCGGGAHNDDMLRRLARHLPETRIATTSEAGLDPDWVEATAFAWLAMRTLSRQSGNLPSVTGASHKVVLGAIHSP